VDSRLKLSNITFLCLAWLRQGIVRGLRVFFLKDRLAFQGLQRFCPCRIVMALVHRAFVVTTTALKCIVYP
jgi:hypothetical protein